MVDEVFVDWLGQTFSFWLGNLTSFFEFPGETARRLIDEVPNNGLIRYHITGNAERLLLTSPDALSEVLVHRPYDFEKPSFVRKALSLFAGAGLLAAKGNAHKGRIVPPYPRR